MRPVQHLPGCTAHTSSGANLSTPRNSIAVGREYQHSDASSSPFLGTPVRSFVAKCRKSVSRRFDVLSATEHSNSDGIELIWSNVNSPPSAGVDSGTAVDFAFRPMPASHRQIT